MPHYDYVCDACGHSLELFQSISESPKRKCPKCGKSKLRRLIGMGAGVLFKGKGFYETDYRSESYKEGERKSAPEAEKPAAAEVTTGADKEAPKPGTDKAEKAEKKGDSGKEAPKKNASDAKRPSGSTKSAETKPKRGRG